MSEEKRMTTLFKLTPDERYFRDEIILNSYLIARYLVVTTNTRVVVMEVRKEERGE